jgi:glyoxylase-like metal-dependent hydrolase (beta-lactamase superfamily II)
MLIHHTQDPQWMADAYVVARGAGGPAIWIDCNGAHNELHDFVAEHDLQVQAILLTHHHIDHIEDLEEVREWYAAPVGASARAIELIRAEGHYAGPIEQVLEEGGNFTCADLEVRSIPTPGHAGGHLAFLIDGTDVFTGDVLFNGTVGGTRAPGHTGLADLKASLSRLLELDDAVVVHPGHTVPTTIGAERAANPFVRYFRGEDAALEESVIAWGEPATLLVWGPDYDGGHKALVRWADGSEDIVGGSRVERR